MFKNKLAVLMIFATGLLANTYTFAESGESYLDVSYGVTAHTVDVANATGTHTSSNTTVDTDSEGYAIILGTFLTNSISGEVSYVNLGSTEIKGDGGNIDSFTLNGTANPVDFTAAETIDREISGFGFGGAFHLGGGSSFDAAIRGGALMWDTSGTKASNTTANDFVNNNLFNSGVDPYIGLSLKYKFNMLSIGLGYDSYGLNSWEDDATLTSLSLGGVF